MDVPERSFVIVGGGKMGESILSGWLAADTAPANSIKPSDVVVVEPGVDRRDFIEGAYRVACVDDVADVDDVLGERKPDVVVLAVKPQVLMGVLESIAKLPIFAGGEEGPLFVSIAAGMTTDSILRVLPAGTPLVRVMPNMPLMVGAGASAVCASKTSSKEQVNFVASLFGSLGRAVVVDESDMDAVCAISGSGPAYVAAMIEAMRDAAVSQGLDAELAETLALQTVLGTAQMIQETGVSPADARIAVCSPGGTTLAALDAMNTAGFDEVFDAGIAAAVRRSRELAECS